MYNVAVNDKLSKSFINKENMIGVNLRAANT